MMILKLNDNSHPQGRKEREWKFRRQEILNAARKVFIEQGYFKTTMSHISAKAEFGMGTLYQFFPSKKDLFISVILEEAQNYIEGIKNIFATSSLWQEKLRFYIEYKLSWIENHPDVQRLIMEIFYTPIPKVTPQIIDRLKEVHVQDILMLKDIFVQANKSGGHSRFDPDLMALVIHGTTDAIANDLLVGTKILKDSPKEYVSSIMNSILGGHNE